MSGLGSTAPSAPLERWTSPAARVLCAIGLVGSVATAPTGPLAIGVGVVIAAAALALTRPSARSFVLRSLPACGMLVALLAPLVIAGEHDRAIGLGARGALSIVIAIAIASAIPAQSVAGALLALKTPRTLAAVIQTMLTQLASVRAEARRLGLARRLRGARGFGVSGGALATLLARSADRARRVALAMELRGYDPERASRDARLSLRDAPVLVGVALLAAGAQLAPRLMTK